MNRFLLALDPSSHSRQAAEYLAAIAGQLEGSQVLLLTVMATWPSGVPSPVTDEPVKMTGEVHGGEDAGELLGKAQAFMAEIVALFQRRGVAASRINRLIVPQDKGVAEDIVAMAQTHECDTVVVGRRDLSAVQAIFLGSVSSELVNSLEGRTVWVVE
ncbi:universal stress protein [Desulfuromonas sp. AOP6]|uniref:universal stress protein n=1 Tax=Desulfuromonas sp. AOP6 TaxID=1566351 RepID=UPI001271732C|nr:universal stress protein [Desulfuromonas sp. AOP6]BCA78298.1 hypothetical protein AOP6_0085 [Desulfuromonas sp. AOP6]